MSDDRCSNCNKEFRIRKARRVHRKDDVEIRRCRYKDRYICENCYKLWKRWGFLMDSDDFKLFKETISKIKKKRRTDAYNKRAKMIYQRKIKYYKSLTADELLAEMGYDVHNNNNKQ